VNPRKGVNVLVNEKRQMTLEVGGDPEQMLIGSFGVSGALGAERELAKGAGVRVVITDADGELVSTSLGYVSQVAFKEHRDGNVRWTERKHTVRLET